MTWTKEHVDRLVASEWVWCQVCQRCYVVESCRLDRQRMVFLCHYEDCDGELRYDGHPWKHVLAFRPEFPATPRRDAVYPLASCHPYSAPV